MTQPLQQGYTCYSFPTVHQLGTNHFNIWICEAILIQTNMLNTFSVTYKGSWKKKKKKEIFLNLVLWATRRLFIHFHGITVISKVCKAFNKVTYIFLLISVICILLRIISPSIRSQMDFSNLSSKSFKLMPLIFYLYIL